MRCRRALRTFGASGAGLQKKPTTRTTVLRMSTSPRRRWPCMASRASWFLFAAASLRPSTSRRWRRGVALPSPTPSTRRAPRTQASPTYISFGAYRREGRRLLAPLDITQPMKRDWRATTYKPADITRELMDVARGRCRFSNDQAPLDDADSTIRTPLSKVTAWAASERDARRECRFSYDDAPCYLMMRKIPKETVLTYLESYKNNLS